MERQAVLEEQVGTHLFSTQKDIAFAAQTYEKFGRHKGKEVTRDVTVNNLVSQVWEASDSLDPFKYKYFAIKKGNRQKLVHESDLVGLDLNTVDFDELKDIEAGISAYRRGTEQKAAKAYKKAIFESKIGQSAYWVSPKREEAFESEEECAYTQSQIMGATKVSEYMLGDMTISEVDVNQFQSRHLNTTKTAQVLNRLAGYRVVHPEAELDDVISAVGLSEGEVSVDKVKLSVEQISGVRHEALIDFKSLEGNIFRLSEVNSRRYLQAIELGISGKALEKLYAGLFKEILTSTFIATKLSSKTQSGEFDLDDLIGINFALPVEMIKTNCSRFDFGGQSGAVQSYLAGSPLYFRSPFGMSRVQEETRAIPESPKKCPSCSKEFYCRSYCPSCNKELQYTIADYS